MKTRMAKYYSSTDVYERTKKNEKLYQAVDEELYSEPKYNNTSILEGGKEIDISKLRTIIDGKEGYEPIRTKPEYDFIESKEERIKEETIHDINEILELAKKNRKFIDEAIEKNKYNDVDINARRIKLYDEEEKHEYKKEKDDDTTTTALNILSDLKPTENTVVTDPIDSDLEKEFASHETEYTGSVTFTNNDFEDVNESIKRDTKIVKIVIVLMIFVLLLIGTYAYWYFIYNK